MSKTFNGRINVLEQAARANEYKRPSIVTFDNGEVRRLSLIEAYKTVSASVEGSGSKVLRVDYVEGFDTKSCGVIPELIEWFFEIENTDTKEYIGKRYDELQ